VASQLNPFEQDGQQFQQGLDAGGDLGQREGQPGQANQAGGDADLSRSLERVAAQEAWLSGPQTGAIDAHLLGDSLAELSLGLGSGSDRTGVSGGSEERRTLVAIDTRVPNWQELTEELPANADLLLLDDGRSGLQQVQEALTAAKSGGSPYRGIALVGVGRNGGVELGGDGLTPSNSEQWSGGLANWADSLNPGSKIKVFAGGDCAAERVAEAANLLQELTGVSTGFDLLTEQRIDSASGTSRVTIAGDAPELLVEARLALRTAKTSGALESAIAKTYAEEAQKAVLDRVDQFLNGKGAPAISWSAFEVTDIQGAFIASKNLILINKELQNESNQEKLKLVLLEEIGHWLESDSGYDSVGDEGERFSNLINGKKADIEFGRESSQLIVDDEIVDAELSADNLTPERTAGSLTNLSVNEDSGLTSLALAGLSYSPGPGETTQTVSYTITATPPATLGAVGYLAVDGSAGSFVQVQSGTVLTLEQLRKLGFKTALDAFGTSSFSFAVTDNDPTVTGTSNPIKTLSSSQASDLEFELKIDLNGDNIAGITVNSELLSKDRDRDASGSFIFHYSDRRYLYSTSGGLLLSNNSLSTGSDLRNAATGSSTYDGPSLLLLKDGSGNSFAAPSGRSILALTAVRDQLNNNTTTGYDLLTKDSAGNYTEYFFGLNGKLTGQNSPSALQLASLEVQTKTDLDGNAIIGTTVSTKVFDKEYDASGRSRSNNSDLRFLYNTSFGLLLSRNSLSTGSDLRNADSASSTYDGPNLTLLGTPDSPFSIASGQSVLTLKVNRETNASGSSVATSYSLLTKDGANVVKQFNFDLTGAPTTQSTLNAAAVAALELELRSDLNADNTVGVTINSILYSKESSSTTASGTYTNTDGNKRYLYSTSGGLLLANNSLTVGSDLRNVYSVTSGGYDGPSLLLLKNTSGASFAIPTGESLLCLTVTRNGSNNANGYSLLTKNTTGTVTQFSFDIKGQLSTERTLSSAELNTLEFEFKTDLNGDGVAGVAISSKLLRKRVETCERKRCSHNNCQRSCRSARRCRSSSVRPSASSQR